MWVSVTPLPLSAPGKGPVPIVQEAGLAAGPVWTSAENLAPTGIQSPDRPARSQSLVYSILRTHIKVFYLETQSLPRSKHTPSRLSKPIS
jgi:hypothetical protein